MCQLICAFWSFFVLCIYVPNSPAFSYILALHEHFIWNFCLICVYFAKRLFYITLFIVFFNTCVHFVWFSLTYKHTQRQVAQGTIWRRFREVQVSKDKWHADAGIVYLVSSYQNVNWKKKSAQPGLHVTDAFCSSQEQQPYLSVSRSVINRCLFDV